MSLKIIRDIRKVFKASSGVIFGRVATGTGRGQELTPAEVRLLLNVGEIGTGGTVTHTGGPLTLNAVVLGAGGDDVKVDPKVRVEFPGGNEAWLELGSPTGGAGVIVLNTVQPGNSAFLCGTASGGIGQKIINLPDHTGTLVTLAGVETLTNKTLTDPVINVAGTDAPGDVYYRNAAGIFTRLGVGADGNVLTVAAGLPAWAAGGGGVLSFTTIAISGQSSVVADLAADTLTLVAGSGITLTTNAATDTITITATAGGGGTVTNTGGVLTLNQVVLGAGSADIKTLAAGTNGNVLTMVGGVAAWAAVGASTFTKASLNTAVTDGDVVFLDSVDTITGVKTMTGSNVIKMANAGLTINNVAGTFDYTIQGGVIGGATILTLPAVAGTLALVSQITGTNSGTNTGDQLTFGTVAVSGQSNVVADLANDTLTLVAGTGITITTNAATDTITITATTGGGGTVTNTAGALTLNQVVLGAGSADIKTLAAGTNGQVLTVVAGVAAWAAVAADTYTMASLDTAVTDGDVMFQGRNETITGIKTLTGPRLATNITQTTEPTSTPTGATQSILLANGNHQTLTLASATVAVTVTLTVPQGPAAGTVLVKQHATVPKDVNWAVSGGTVNWLTTEPDWVTDPAGSIRVLSWRYDGSVLHLLAYGSSGAGTVTATGGALTANSIVLGAGTTDTKVLPAFTTDGTSQLNLGQASSSAGKLKLFSLLGGDVTLQGTASANTGVVVTMPVVSSALATIALTETLVNKTLTAPIINAGSDANGDIYFRSGTTFTRLPIGAAGNVLTVNTGFPSWAAPGGGSGTVTNAGNLTQDSIVLGTGTTGVKVVGGITTDGVSIINLGVVGTVAGRVKFNATVSGDATLTAQATSTAGTLITLPNATSQLATLTLTEALSNKTLTSPKINVGSDVTGDIYYRNSGGLFTRIPIGATNDVLKVSAGLPVWAAPGGGTGTVTNTGGALTANGVMMGAGTNDSKVHAGLTVSPGSPTALNIGNNTTIAGHLLLWNGTGFSNTLSNNASSVANSTVTMPLLSGVMATQNAVETFTNKTIVLNSTIRLATETTVTPTGTTATVDLTLGNHQTLNLASSTGTVVVTLTNPATSAAGTIIVKQHGTTPRAITWPVGAKWMGVQPTWASDAVNAVRIVSWRWDGSVMRLASTGVEV